MHRILAAAVVGVLVLLGAAGCDQYKERQGTLDAPIARTEKDGWVVFAAPDGFPNVAFRCNGKTGMYAARQTKDDVPRQVTAVPNDPSCP